jgi:hypothetical protein
MKGLFFLFNIIYTSLYFNYRFYLYDVLQKKNLRELNKNFFFNNVFKSKKKKKKVK